MKTDYENQMFNYSLLPLTYSQAVVNSAKGGHVYVLYLDEFETIRDVYYMPINEVRELNDLKKDNIIFFEVLKNEN